MNNLNVIKKNSKFFRKWTNFNKHLICLMLLSLLLLPLEASLQTITIDTQPTDQSTCEGASTTFSVSASSSENLNYQWQKVKPDGGAWRVYAKQVLAPLGFPPGWARSIVKYDNTIYVGADCGIVSLPTDQEVEEWTLYNNVSGPTGYPGTRGAIALAEYNGVLYAVPESNSKLLSLDLANNATEWTLYDRTTHSNLPSSNFEDVSIWDGVIYLATRNGVFSLDIANGATVWNALPNFLPQGESLWHIHTSDGILYAAGDNKVGTLDIANNASTWTVYSNVLGPSGFPSRITEMFAHNGIVYLGTWTSGLASLDIANNATSWTTYNTSGSPSGFPSNRVDNVFYADGILYAATSRGLATLDVGNNATAWKVHNTSSRNPSGFPQRGVVNFVQVIDDVVYAGHVEGLATLQLETSMDISSNGNTSSFTINPTTAADAAYTYRVKVTTDGGEMVLSEEGSLELTSKYTISSQPKDYAACTGEEIHFSVLGYGQGTYAYQWQKVTGGVAADITDATDPTYSFTPVLSDDGSQYQVVITETTNCGAITSNMANLSVTQAGSITTQPEDQTICSGNDATFSVSATGSNLTYQWQKVCPEPANWTVYSTRADNPTNFPDDGANDVVTYNGKIYATTDEGLAILDVANNATEWEVYTTTNGPTGLPTNTLYRMLLDDGKLYIATRSGLAILDIANNATSWTVYGRNEFSGSDFVEDVYIADGVIYVANGLSGIHSLDIANGATEWTQYHGFDCADTSLPPTFVTKVYAANGVIYATLVDFFSTNHHGLATLDVANGATEWTIYRAEKNGFPSFSTGEVLVVDGVVYIASGSGIASLDIANNSTEWSVFTTSTGPTGLLGNQNGSLYYTNGVLYVGGSRGISTLDIANKASEWTPYRENSRGMPRAPYTNVYVADGVLYGVGYLAGLVVLPLEKVTDITPNGTGTSITITNPTIADTECGYRVLVSENGGCPVASDIAYIHLGTPFSISTHPSSQTLCAEELATFTVEGTGSGDYTYQWQEVINGVVTNIDGATELTYSFNPTFEDNGNKYQLVITAANNCGVVTSNQADLTVQPIANITEQPTDQATCSGGGATFDVTATGTNLSYQWQQVVVEGAAWTAYTTSLDNTTNFPTNTTYGSSLYNGVIYVATRSGLAILDIGNNSTEWTVHSTSTGLPNFPSNLVYDVTVYNGVVYAATDGGLATLDIDNNATEWTVYHRDVASGFPGYSIRSVYVSNGVIYVGTQFGGYGSLDIGNNATTWTRVRTFEHPSLPSDGINAFYEFNGVLYIATSNGVGSLNIANNETTWTTYNSSTGPSGFPNDRVQDIFVANGIIYAATYSGLATLDIANNATEWTVYNTSTATPSGFPSDYVDGVTFFDGVIYAATNSGIGILDIANNATEWKRYNSSSGPSGFPSFWARKLKVTDGQLLVAAGSGFAMLQLAQENDIDPGGDTDSYTIASPTASDGKFDYRVLISENGMCSISSDIVDLSIGAGPCCEIDITNVSITDKTCSDDTAGKITVSATCTSCINGGSDIRYSINGTDFQVSNVFTNVAAGTYTVTARDVNNESCTDTKTEQEVKTLVSEVNAGADQFDVCGTVITLDATAITIGNGSWSVIDGDGNDDLDDASDPVSLFSGSLGVIYTLRWTHDCSPMFFDEVKVQISPDSDNDTFQDCVDCCPGGDDRINQDGDLSPDACDCDEQNHDADYVNVSGLPFTDDQIVPSTYFAEKTLTGIGIVKNGDSTVFKAVETIILNQGFHAQAGSDFTAMITKVCTFPDQGNTLLANNTLAQSRATLNTNLELKPVTIDLAIAPNPFSIETKISFELPTTEEVSLQVFNQTGQLVTSLLEKTTLEKGTHSFDLNGQTLGSGMLLVRLSTTKTQLIKKVVLIGDTASMGN